MNRAMKGKAETRDRVSDLPDEVLHHILSFLDTKNTVRTSVLSKRWRHVWASVPCLSLNCESFGNHEAFLKVLFQFLSRRDAYSNFSALRNVCIRCIHFIDYVVNNLSHRPALQSLTKLELMYFASSKVLFDFVTLTELNLECCQFFSCGDTYDPFKGCVNLKRLRLSECCFCCKIKRFQVTAPHLTHLTISKFSIPGSNTDSEIVLSTPKIKSFGFIYAKGRPIKFIMTVDLQFIEKVNIDVVPNNAIFSIQEPPKNDALCLTKLFEGLANTKFLTLSRGIIQVLSESANVLYGRPSAFTKLEGFELKEKGSPGISFPVPCKVMVYLFGACPVNVGHVKLLAFTGPCSSPSAVTEEEIRGFIMQNTRVTTRDLLVAFQTKLRSLQDLKAYAEILKRICTLKKIDGSTFCYLENRIRRNLLRS